MFLIKIENKVIKVPILPRKFTYQRKDDPDFRRALYESYNKICPYCGQPINKISEMQVDHILPQEYKELPELKEYINYLRECGFDISKPDYVENYMPSHGDCNRTKSNHVNPFALVSFHEKAESKKRKVLELYQKYKKSSI